jgi:hypothetical protein
VSRLAVCLRVHVAAGGLAALDVLCHVIARS